MNSVSVGERRISPVDRLITGFDAALRAFSPRPGVGRPSPAADVLDAPLTPRERRHSAGLMRVNHTGEVCAQALYLGQAAVARQPRLKTRLRAAAREERDHLRWCALRLRELDARPSRLDPAWFISSLAIGVCAAAHSDSTSLGFVEETERQVCRHLDGHLDQLPELDLRSRAIVEAMRADEARHAADAHRYGARELSPLVRRVMAGQARVMTTLAYWL